MFSSQSSQLTKLENVALKKKEVQQSTNVRKCVSSLPTLVSINTPVVTETESGTRFLIYQLALNYIYRKLFFFVTMKGSKLKKVKEASQKYETGGKSWAFEFRTFFKLTAFRYLISIKIWLLICFYTIFDVFSYMKSWTRAHEGQYCHFWALGD